MLIFYKNINVKGVIYHKKKILSLVLTLITMLTYLTPISSTAKEVKTSLLGHSDISITANIYTHLMPKEKIDAAEKLNDIFL